MTAPELPTGAQRLVARARAGLSGPCGAVGLAPGRINVLGEHTDYIGGFSLPTAIDRWCAVALRPVEAGTLTLRALDLDETWTGRLGEVPEAPSWARTMAGAVAEFSRRVPLTTGLEAAVTGDVPRGGGLSSSAALCVAWMNALQALADSALSDLELARTAQAVEHTWTGVQCGLLDQTASQCSTGRGYLQVDFRDFALTEVTSALTGVAWLVLDTGVRRELAGSAYATRVAEVREGLHRARGAGAHWRDLTAADLHHGDRLDQRLGHGLAENARVHAGAAAIEAGDAVALGRLLDESHASLRDDYAVSCAELNTLVETARAQTGCLGARMMGGGFGGCAVALVRASQAEAIADAVLAAYRAAHPHSPAAFVVRPTAGACGWREAPPA